MSVQSTEDLLTEGLKHMYFTEQQLVDALEELEESTSTEELKEGFAAHRSETEQHVERLEEVFEQLGEEPEAEEDPVVEGIVESHEEFMGKDPEDESAIDRFNLTAGMKSEHYEIAAYDNLITLAESQGHEEASQLLTENLEDERKELETLEEKASQFDQGDL